MIGLAARTRPRNRLLPLRRTNNQHSRLFNRRVIMQCTHQMMVVDDVMVRAFKWPRPGFAAGIPRWPEGLTPWLPIDGSWFHQTLRGRIAAPRPATFHVGSA